MSFLIPNKKVIVHGLEIKQKIIPWGAIWTKDYIENGIIKNVKGSKYKADMLLNGTGKPDFITIHNTNRIKVKGTTEAEQYTRATYPNQNMGKARVHYYVDENDCWQNLLDTEIGWHAGTGSSTTAGNYDSIAIEIIMSTDVTTENVKSQDRGALLAAILLDRHNLTIDRLRKHQDWSGKYCPSCIIPHWNKFINAVQKYLNEMQNTSSKSLQAFNIGDFVQFQGGYHYTTCDSEEAVRLCKAGEAKIINVKLNSKHPYALQHTEKSTSNVYGWVNANTITILNSIDKTICEANKYGIIKVPEYWQKIFNGIENANPIWIKEAFDNAIEIIRSHDA